MKRPTDYTSDMSRHSSSPDALRRRLLQLAALAPLSSLLQAQSASSPIAVLKLHTFGLRVSDVERSVAFYQRLFGMPIQARQGSTVCLRIGEGPRFMSLSPTGPGESPGITHIGLSVEGYDGRAIAAQLQAKGFQADANGADKAPLERAMHFWPLNDQALAFSDREGLNFQLCSPAYCGSANGQCSNTPSAEAGLMALEDINHFTNYMNHAPNTNAFYLDLFGLHYQSYQGPTSPTVGVGDGKQFLMFVGGAREGTPANPARIDHVSLAMFDFNVEQVQAKLESVGITPRANADETPPLVHWVSLRMPNRGGAEGGTPELYFSDPDGLHIQLQDVSYCGGGGYLGDECAPLA
ncbi:MAG: hypothetical protein KDI28_08080 [Pseudomonadales bacterium]|nr:hypothetical protein [Pseudomonadales bacterium]